MARTNGGFWQTAGKVELTYALWLAGAPLLGVGGLIVTVIANAPLWAVVSLALTACVGSAVLPVIVLRRVFNQKLDEVLQDVDMVIEGYDKRMERQREGLGQLWKFAHERGLLEQIEKDKEAARHLQQLREDVYGVVPTPRGGERKISEIPRFLRSTRRRRR